MSAEQESTDREAMEAAVAWGLSPTDRPALALAQHVAASRKEIAAAWFAGYDKGNLDGYFGTRTERDKSPYADLDPYREDAPPGETAGEGFARVGRRVHHVDMPRTVLVGSPRVALCGTVFIPTELNPTDVPECRDCAELAVSRSWHEADQHLDAAQILTERLNRSETR